MQAQSISSAYLLSVIATCRLYGKSLSSQIAKSGRFAIYAGVAIFRSGNGSCSAPGLNTACFEATVLSRYSQTETNIASCAVQ